MSKIFQTPFWGGRRIQLFSAVYTCQKGKACGLPFSLSLAERCILRQRKAFRKRGYEIPCRRMTTKMLRRTVGKNYIEYITELRMRETYRLLEDTDLNIQDITLEVG